MKGLRWHDIDLEIAIMVRFGDIYPIKKMHFFKLKCCNEKTNGIQWYKIKNDKHKKWLVIYL